MIDKISQIIRAILLIAGIAAMIAAALAAAPALAIALLIPSIPLIHAIAAIIITASFAFSIAGLAAGFGVLLSFSDDY